MKTWDTIALRRLWPIFPLSFLQVPRVLSALWTIATHMTWGSVMCSRINPRFEVRPGLQSQLYHLKPLYVTLGRALPFCEPSFFICKMRNLNKWISEVLLTWAFCDARIGHPLLFAKKWQLSASSCNEGMFGLLWSKVLENIPQIYISWNFASRYEN